VGIRSNESIGQGIGTRMMEVIIHMHTGEEINLKDTKDMIYTLSNCACDDWEIIKEW
jgi:hypothetical protein